MDLKDLLKKSKAELAKRKATAAIKNSKSGLNTPKPKNELLTKKLRSWNKKSLDELMTVDTSARKYAYLGNDEISLVRQLKEDVDTAIVLAKVLGVKVTDTTFFKEEVSFTLKAFGIGSGDDGFDWIPTVVSDAYIDEFNLERKVSGLFFEVKMPSNPFKWPVLSNGAISRKVGQASSINKQVFNTNETIQFDAVKLASRYELPEELNEDSAPDIIKAIRIELIEGQEKAVEIAILEGDAAGTQHNFSQLPDVAGGTTIASISADTPETAWDGIRTRVRQAGAGATVDAGDNAVTETELSGVRRKMGKFGVDPSQLAVISGPKVYNQLLQLDDVRTLEQYGAQATVLTGELAKYEGIPVVVSEYLREDLNSLGVNSATVLDNVRGSILLVNRKRWYTGMRRAVQVRVENNKTEFDVLDMVSFQRYAFQAVLKADGSNYAAESSAALVFNIGAL